MELSAERLRSAGSTQHLEQVASRGSGDGPVRNAPGDHGVVFACPPCHICESNDFDRVMAGGLDGKNNTCLSQHTTVTQGG